MIKSRPPIPGGLFSIPKRPQNLCQGLRGLGVHLMSRAFDDAKLPGGEPLRQFHRGFAVCPVLFTADCQGGAGDCFQAVPKVQVHLFRMSDGIFQSQNAAKRQSAQAQRPGDGVAVRGKPLYSAAYVRGPCPKSAASSGQAAAPPSSSVSRTRSQLAALCPKPCRNRYVIPITSFPAVVPCRPAGCKAVGGTGGYPFRAHSCFSCSNRVKYF